MVVDRRRHRGARRGAARQGTAAAAAGPVSRDTRIGPFDLNFVVDPARTGTNEIHLYLLNRSTGQPVNVDETRVSASLPAAGIGPLRFTATPAGPGHAIVTAASFPLAGTWRLLVEVRKGDFDQWSTTLTIPIRKDTRTMKSTLITLLAIAVAGLALAGVAQAHVTVHPNALPSGGFTVVNVQVPNERDKASTVKVDVQLPPGVFFLSTAADARAGPPRSSSRSSPSR